MASSSTSTDEASFPPLTYDVFLSFRGKDTRKSYVDFLYSFLKLRGIYTYKDDITLPRGDTIHPSLMRAIRESQIAIIVFSKNYADSSWCLRELEYIMECRRTGNLIVMPVFYDVTIDDVKDLTGEFGEGFAKQLSKHSSNIESWKEAIMTATTIAGSETMYMANGHQAAGIKEIVDNVSQRLRALDPNANENLIGIETRMEDLMSKLEIGSGGVRMVGIWGIGGGGKTTLASYVFTKISSEFEGSCLVQNIREQASKNGLEKLQQGVLSDILKEKFKVRSVPHGTDLIRGRLRNRKKILIVLDDIDNIGQLEALAGSHDWFGPGSRIIITTRNEHVLNVRDVDAKYNVSLLNEDEAIRLLRRYALRKRGPIENYDEISRLSLKVVCYARGLPLALKVLGIYLCDKKMSEWTAALKRLRYFPDAGIMEQLKLSYDGLTHVQQQLFLDIACFFRQWPQNDAMKVLDSCGFHPGIGVEDLRQKALVTISNGRFDMHDLIQEMGHNIVRGKHPSNPEKHSRVWKDEEIAYMCNLDDTTVNSDIEALHAPYYDAPSNLFKFVSNLRNLRSVYVSQCVNHVVEEPLFLSQRLLWISWQHYPASSLPTSFQPRFLVRLILKNGLQEELWKGSKELPELQVLDLSDSKNLIKTPDLGKVKKLQRLVLSGCSNLTDLHPSIGCHEGIVYLNLDGCHKLEMFPSIIAMEKLETLILSRCSKLRKFPTIQGKMDSLKHLNLDNSGIEVVPSSIGWYCANLVSVSFIGCINLKSIECDFRLLKQRWSISVGGHDTIKRK